MGPNTPSYVTVTHILLLGASEEVGGEVGENVTVAACAVGG